MPKPNPNESKEDYISRFMSSEEAQKDYPDEKQRLAVANSMWEKHKGKHKETTTFFVKIKEAQNRYSFIGASTLPDRVSSYLGDGTKIKGEILSKNVLDKFAGYINDTSRLGGDYGSYRTISLFHNRVRQGDYTLEEAGYVVPGSAYVKELDEYPGNFGLVVDVEVNEKYKPPEEYADYDPDKIKYKIDKGVLGLSIEYLNRPEQEKIVEVNGDKYRYILDSDDFRGFGFARADLIGNPTTVRIKEQNLAEEIKMTETINKEELLAKELEETRVKLADAEAKLAEAPSESFNADDFGAKMKEMEAKVKELQTKINLETVKMKETIEESFSSTKLQTPAKTKEMEPKAKIKETYDCISNKDWVKFKELVDSQIETKAVQIKELLARDGRGFDFERYQTLGVKCKGNMMVVVPTAKTKDIIDTTDMAESTYYQTNAMFADRYTAGITETFLKEDSLLKIMPKEQHLGGNDKYQWRLWITYGDVDSTNTAAVDPNNTSVARTQRNFEKLETRICEYRDGVEVTDFTQHHSMAAIGDLLGIEIQRAAEYVTESMNSDLFKAKTDTTASWNGFLGLIGVADSATYTTMYGKTRSATNRLLDSTTANTYSSTSEAISVSLVRAAYEKVLAHGSRLSDIVIVMHPTQCRRLFDTEDAAIRYNVLSMAGAPADWGFSRAILPHIDGIPIVRDYRCESSSAAADSFAVVDLSGDKGFVLVVSKPLGVRGLAKVGTSESAYVSFWGAAVYKSPRNVFVHTGLTAT